MLHDQGLLTSRRAPSLVGLASAACEALLDGYTNAVTSMPTQVTVTTCILSHGRSTGRLHVQTNRLIPPNTRACCKACIHAVMHVKAAAWRASWQAHGPSSRHTGAMQGEQPPPYTAGMETETFEDGALDTSVRKARRPSYTASYIQAACAWVITHLHM